MVRTLYLLAALQSLFAQETLRYQISWPSGLSLGEATLSQKKSGAGKELEFQIDASVPGFTVADRFRSLTGAGGCSLEFYKEITHGRRKAKEKITFQPQGGATRETTGGGKSEIPTPACGRDALAFLDHLRTEIAQGRVPPAQTVLWGAPYQVRLEFKGSRVITVSDQRTDADLLLVSIKGPASDHTFELFYGRDAARTLVMARVPFPLGSFTMELMR